MFEYFRHETRQDMGSKIPTSKGWQNPIVRRVCAIISGTFSFVLPTWLRVLAVQERGGGDGWALHSLRTGSFYFCQIIIIISAIGIIVITRQTGSQAVSLANVDPPLLVLANFDPPLLGDQPPKKVSCSPSRGDWDTDGWEGRGSASMLFVVALVLLLGHHLLLTTAVTSSDSRINVLSAFESILGITGRHHQDSRQWCWWQWWQIQSRSMMTQKWKWW